MAGNSGNDNPYVGPRPFSTSDRDRFFGREREASDLLSLVIAERLVLFYAQSGAGKSSLINTRLIPGLAERNFQVLPVGRVSGQSAESDAVRNIFSYNLIRSLAGQKTVDPAALPEMTLSQYLGQLEVTPAPEPDGNGKAGGGVQTNEMILDAPVVVAGVRPLALIIDQFEEIFTSHLESWQQRAAFFEQLCAAIENDPYLWVVLVMREDYIAGLDPYLYLLPGRLRARYYMQRMAYEAALEAIQKPALRAGKPFEAGVAEDLVNNMRLVASGQNEEGKPVYVPGQFIEPVQLQVVCYQLWEQLRDDDTPAITMADLRKLARGEDLAAFVSNALADFYNQAVGAVVQEYPGVSERELRELFSRKLITEAGTRGLVFKGDDTTEGLPNEVMNRLEARFLIRTEKRGGSTWYELVHDRFVAPILQANHEWYEKNPRPYQADAEAWLAAGRSRSKLYEGRKLGEAVKAMKENPAALSDLEREFIQVSQSAAEQQQSLRQRRLMIFFIALALILASLAGLSLVGWNRADQNAAIAGQQRATAVEAGANEARQRQTAEAASAKEALQRRTAEAFGALEAQLRQTAEAASVAESIQRQTAVAAGVKEGQLRQTAEAAKAAADTANLLSQAGRLSSLSNYFREKNLPLSLLLSVEGVALSDNWETRRALLDSIQKGLSVKLDRDGAPVNTNDPVYSIAYDYRGDMLAMGLFSGDVRVVSAEGHGAALTPPAGFIGKSPVTSVAFNKQGDYLATGSIDGYVRLWKMGSAQVELFQPLAKDYTFFPPVTGVTFQPDGNYLAVATEIEGKTQAGHAIVYDYLQKQVAGDIRCPNAVCTAIAWSLDGKKLAVGDRVGGIRVWNAVTRKESLNLGRIHRDKITGLGWYPDGKRLVSGSIDSRLIQWDTGNGKVLVDSSIYGPAQKVIVLGLSLSSNGRFLVVGSSDTANRVTVYDAETLQQQKFPTLQGSHVQSVEAVAFSPLGDHFATGAKDNYVFFWQFNPVDSLAEPAWTIPAQTGKGRGNSVALGQKQPGEAWIAQKVGNSEVDVWGQTGAQPVEISGIPFVSAAFGALEGQTRLALGGYNGVVTLLDPAGGQMVKEIPLAKGTLAAVALSSDGRWLAGAACGSPGVCNQLVVWDLIKNEAISPPEGLPELNIRSISSLAFRADGSLLALGTDDSRIVVIDLPNNTLTQAVNEGLNLQGINLPVTSVSFGPEETNLLAAGFYDGRIALWEASSLDPIGEFADRMGDQVSGLAFTRPAPDAGWALNSISLQGVMWQWQVDRQTWAQRACLLANRTLTPDEQEKFMPANRQQDQPCAPASQ